MASERHPARLGGTYERRLTARQAQVLGLVADGHTTAEIAARLGLSSRTVEMHRANGMRSLGIYSRVEIVQWAIRTGYFAA